VLLIKHQQLATVGISPVVTKEQPILEFRYDMFHAHVKKFPFPSLVYILTWHFLVQRTRDYQLKVLVLLPPWDLSSEICCESQSIVNTNA
jgi:hypothetical protein